MYAKYNSPLEYLDTSFEIIGLYETVLQIYNERNNRELWEMYLSVKPNSSFKDWKKQVAPIDITYNQNYGTKNKEETKQIVEMTQSILGSFKLKK